MSRFAKLLLALLAVFAMSFLMPGLARAEDPAAPTGTTTTSGNGASSGDPTAGDPAGAGQQPVIGSSQRAAVVPAAPLVTGDPPVCTNPNQPPGCTPPCTLDAFKNLPVCSPTTPPPPKTCEALTDLPHCIPDCAFLADVLHQAVCTTLPQCLDPTMLPPNFPTIPGVPVCDPNHPPTSGPPPHHDGVYYKNCTDARAHGATNIHRGDPGYRRALDRDNDGVACEDSTTTTTTTTSTPTTIARPVAVTPQTPAAPVVAQLAYTGAVPAPLMATGFGLVLGGAGLLRLARRAR